MTRRTIVAIALVIVGLAACADPADPGSDGNGGSTGSSGAIAHATGASDLVLQVGYQGGYTPVEYQLTNMPFFSLYGDGTLITPGPQIEIYPGPALASINQQTVTEDGVQAILQAALDAGLGEANDMADLGSVGIADAADTVFTIRTDELDRTIRVYALSELGPDRPPGMDRDEFEARQQLSGLVNDLSDLASWLPAGALHDDQTAYEAPGARVYVGEYRGSSDLPQPAIAWPLEAPLGSFGTSDSTYGYGCTVVAGTDWTDSVSPLAVGANQLSPWRSDGERYSLVFRQLLPDEVDTAGC
jgi:hypothetical protein